MGRGLQYTTPQKLHKIICLNPKPHAQGPPCATEGDNSDQRFEASDVAMLVRKPGALYGIEVICGMDVYRDTLPQLWSISGKEHGQLTGGCVLFSESCYSKAEAALITVYIGYVVILVYWGHAGNSIHSSVQDLKGLGFCSP